MLLFQANRQWSERPADERFPTLQALYDQTKKYAQSATEREANIADIRTEHKDGEILLVGRQNIPAKFTYWSFGQLCSRIKAPAEYLRSLGATLTVQNINHGLAKIKQSDETGKLNLLFHENGDVLLRAVTSDKYSRIWNWEVAERMLKLEEFGWEPAKPDTHWGQDNVGECIMCQGVGKVVRNQTQFEQCKHCVGTGKEYPALYASDHDMFAFLRNKSVVIKEDGNPDGLQRGVIVENSEVGAGALKMTRFLYREMCGNFLVWGIAKVMDVSLRHVGKVHGRFENLYQAEIRKYAEASASEDEARIKQAKTKIMAKTKEEVLDLLFGKRLASRKVLEASYEAVVPEQDGDPNSVWGFAQGMTRHSQNTAYADQRMEIDRAAGKLLDSVF